MPYSSVLKDLCVKNRYMANKNPLTCTHKYHTQSWNYYDELSLSVVQKCRNMSLFSSSLLVRHNLQKNTLQISWLKKTAQEIARIIILTSSHQPAALPLSTCCTWSRQFEEREDCLWQCIGYFFFFDVICSILCLLAKCDNLSSYVQIKIVVICYVLR